MTVNTRLANRLGGTSGWCDRSSTTANAPSATIPPTPTASVIGLAPSLDMVSAHVIAPSPTTARPTPSTSNSWLACGLRDSGTTRIVIATTSAANGTLTQNAQVQLCSTSHPPRIGPEAVA